VISIYLTDNDVLECYKSEYKRNIQSRYKNTTFDKFTFITTFQSLQVLEIEIKKRNLQIPDLFNK